MEHIFDFIYENFFVGIYIIALGTAFTLYTNQNNIENYLLDSTTNVDSYVVAKRNEVFKNIDSNISGNKVVAQILKSKFSEDLYINGVKWSYKDTYTNDDLRLINLDGKYKKEEYVLDDGNVETYLSLVN